jgi:hypothetical protein
MITGKVHPTRPIHRSQALLAGSVAVDDRLATIIGAPKSGSAEAMFNLGVLEENLSHVEEARA